MVAVFAFFCKKRKIVIAGLLGMWATRSVVQAIGEFVEAAGRWADPQNPHERHVHKAPLFL
jgi:hypothetical protein